MSVSMPPLLLPGLLAAAIAGPFRYAEDRAPLVVNPLFTTTMAEARLDELLFEGLFSEDRELRVVPRLASGITVDPDLRGATVRLAAGRQWHDGRPVTAEDVTFTVAAAQHPETRATLAGRVAFIAEARAVDRTTVRLRFTAPIADPAARLTFPILPRHGFSGPAVPRDSAFHRHPVGTGPFELRRFEDDGSISMVRSTVDPTPAALPELALREVSDRAYQARLLLYEGLECLVRVLPRDLALLQAQRNVVLYPYQTNAWWYLGFNLKDPRFTDARVREAVAVAMDVDALLAPIGTGRRLSGPFVPASPWYAHDVPLDRPDPSRLTRLLEDAGYTRASGGWERGGVPLQVRVLTHRNLEAAQEVLVQLQAQLRAHGIGLELEFVDEAAWRGRVAAGSFELLLSQWSFDRHEDIREQFHSRGSRNPLGYADAEVDRLLDAARDATDPQARRQALQAAHRKIAQGRPMVFLWTLDSYAAFRSNVKNVAVHPFGFFTWVRDWVVQ